MKKAFKIILESILQVFNFFPIKKNRIFFMSFDGTKVGYDSKAFADWLNENHEKEYELIWGTKDEKIAKTLSLKNTKFVKIKSILGIYYLKTSKVIMCNINPPSFIKYRNNQIIVNTWHGFAFKKCGKYTEDFDKERFNQSTCFLSHSKLYTEQLIRESFEYSGEVLNIGTPRNDILFDKKRREEKANEVRKNFSIDNNKKVLIYAPTFRNNYEMGNLSIDILSVKKMFEKRFNTDVVVFLRLHPLIAENYKVKFESIVNVSSYSNMQDLLCASDYLITDYSSCIWDFGLMKRPAFIYADDYDNYRKNRGLYSPLEDSPFPVAENNEELLVNIENFDEKEYDKKAKRYYNQIVTYDQGHSCEKLYMYLAKKGFE